jgi:tetratricopeptide (TPR) repeat protein
MKIKPIYIYLITFVVFGLAVILFSSNTKKSEPSNPHMQQGQMPNDDIHKGINSDDAPSKSNVSQDAIQKMAELKTAVDKNPKDTAKVREYADMLVFHQPEEAEKYFQKILNIDPKRVDVLLQLTLISFNKRDFNKAEKYTNIILKNDPANATAHYNLGAIAGAKGDNKKARSIWEDVVKKYPNTGGGKVASNALKQLDMMK